MSHHLRRLSTNACNVSNVSTACSFNSALFTGAIRDIVTVIVLYIVEGQREAL